MIPSDANAASEPPREPEIETKPATQTRVACDGGGGALGHPRVYLEMGAQGQIDCPYCGCRFVLAAP